MISKDEIRGKVGQAMSEFGDAIDAAIGDAIAAESEATHRIETLAAAVAAFEAVEQLPAFIQAADDAGLSVREWMVDRLLASIDTSSCYLPIRRTVFERLERLASHRSMRLEQVGEGHRISDILEKALNNGQI